MISMGIFKACPTVSTYRAEFCVEVRVNYRSIFMIVVGALMVTRRYVNVLVWRHEKRHLQSKTHRKHSYTTHGL